MAPPSRSRTWRCSCSPASWIACWPRASEHVVVVCATSGDTGGAAVEAFRGSERVQAVVLFPNGRISDVQRRMITTATEPNVHAVAIEGTFDDCQALVKAMFNDLAFRDRVRLAGVNSINWARVVAQITYYFAAASALGAPNRAVTFSVPTGNFGDIFAGYAAKRMGLPVAGLVIATNENDILERTYRSGAYELRDVVTTTSPSMDIQVSSNFERYLFESVERDPAEVRARMGALKTVGPVRASRRLALEFMRRDFAAGAATMPEVAKRIAEVKARSGYVLDPHTACGVVALDKAKIDTNAPRVVLATAHPAKFPETLSSDHGRAPRAADGPGISDDRQGAHHGAGQRSRRRAAFRPASRNSGEGSVMSRNYTELPNGLRVVSHHMPHLETISMGVWIGVGARHETVNEQGISHLLEHMAFKGTETRSARDIAEQIEAVGAELNAATSLEMTSYFSRALAGDVRLALDILADILQRPRHQQEELEREREVILQEIAATRDSPDEIAYELLQEASFPDQAVGRPILGTTKSVKGFQPADLRAFSSSNYGAKRMILSAAGKIDHAALVRHAEALFGGMNGGAGGRIEPARYVGGTRSSTKPFEQSHLLMAFEGPSYLQPDYYTAQVFSSLFGGGMSSRLFQEVRERRGLCYSIYSSFWALADSGVFAMHASTGQQMIEKLIEVVTAELRRAATEAPAEAEVARAKAQMKAGMLMGLESSSARAEYQARQLLLFDRLIETEEVIGRIDAVTPEMVRVLAAKLITASNPTVVVVGAGRKSAGYAKMAETLAREDKVARAS